MPLNLYRRHQNGCAAGHATESRSSEFDERKKGWKRCGCFIYASGNLAGVFKRKYTGVSQWDQAREIAAQWETNRRWDRAVTVAPPPPVAQPERATIAMATAAYLVRCANSGIENSTLSKYQTFVKQLHSYCADRGYVMLDQLTVSDMDRFSASWKDGKSSKARKLDRLKSFVKFSVKRGWMPKDITDDLKAPKGSSTPADKAPFSDLELERMYTACHSVHPKPPGPGHRDWDGEDALDFIMLSIYTGLRISDVATFDTSKRLKGNDVFLRMHKTKKELYTWIPTWLVNRLRAREKKYGPLIFKTGESLVMRTMAELWRVKLRYIFRLAGPFEETPTPHRYRHTFVRILLEKGVPVADVAELAGDTEEMIRRHYSKWVTTRQARLTKILQEAFEDKPKLVALEGGRKEA